MTGANGAAKATASRPSLTVLKLITKNLREGNAAAEQAVWNLWGLVSSWNPDWRWNQDRLLSLAESEGVDVVELLTDLLDRPDDGLKSRTLGTLVQLTYHNQGGKLKISQNGRLMATLVRFLKMDTFMSMALQDVTLWAARLISSLCSTPLVNTQSCQAVLDHPGLIDALLHLATHSAGGSLGAEVLRALCNLSYLDPAHHGPLRCKAVESFLLSFLDYEQTSQDSVRRALWAMLAIANTWGADAGREALRAEEVFAVVSAFQAVLDEGPWHLGDPNMYGTLDCIEVDQSHDCALRIFPTSVLVPLERLSRRPSGCATLSACGMERLATKFLNTFAAKQQQAMRKAESHEIMRAKLAAIHAPVSAPASLPPAAAHSPAPSSSSPTPPAARPSASSTPTKSATPAPPGGSPVKRTPSPSIRASASASASSGPSPGPKGLRATEPPSKGLVQGVGAGTPEPSPPHGPGAAAAADAAGHRLGSGLPAEGSDEDSQTVRTLLLVMGLLRNLCGQAGLGLPGDATELVPALSYFLVDRSHQVPLPASVPRVPAA